MLYVVALVTFIASIAFWFEYTKPFIETEGSDPSFDLAINPLALILDFIHAILIGVEQKRRIPFGVYMHGLLILLTAIVLVRAFIIDPLGS